MVDISVHNNTSVLLATCWYQGETCLICIPSVCVYNKQSIKIKQICGL